MRKWPVLVALACSVVAAIVVRGRWNERTAGDAPEVAAPPSAPAAAPRPRDEASESPAEEAGTDAAPAAPPPRAERRTLLVCKEEAQETEPIAGAEVTLERRDGSTVTVTTGADGTARLDDDAEAGRALRVSAPGRVRHGWFHDDRRGWLPEKARLEIGTEVTGRVVDARDGRPVAGAELAAVQESNFGGGGNGPPPPPAFEDRTTSGADGRFRFPGVPRPNTHASLFRGAVAVRVSRAGYVTALRTPALLPSDDTADPLLIRLDPDAEIAGVVRDPDGAPVAGARVRARPSESRWYFDDVATAVSDEQGRFRIRGLGSGAHVALEADARGFAASERQEVVAPPEAPVVLTLRRLRSFRLRVAGPDGDDVKQCDVAVFVPRCETNIASPKGDSPVAIGPVEPGRVGFMVSAPGMASAFRWFDDSPADGGSLSMSLDPAASLEGVVVDDDGRPVADASVAVGPSTWSGCQASRYLVRESTTDERGAFRVEGLGAGDLVLDARGPQHVRVVRPVRASDSPLRVVLTRMGSLDAAVLAPAGHEVTPYCGVYISEDAPRFDLPPWEGGDGRHHLGGAVRDAKLHVEGLPPGRYAITLCMSGFVNARIEADVLPGRVTRAAEVRLDPGLRIEGEVLDPRGRPLPGVRVSSLGREWDSGVGDTDETGRFRMGELLPGRHLLGVASPGMAARLEVDVQTGAGPVTLRMQPTRRVRIRLRDDAGAPLLSGQIQVLNAVSLDFPRLPDACGNTDWELLPGSYETRCFDGGGLPVTSPSIVVDPAPAGDDPGVEIVLRLPAKPAASQPK